MNENNTQSLKSDSPSRNYWIAVTVIIITVLIVGGIIYAWQNSNFKSTEKALHEQIISLQNQVNQLKQAQQGQVIFDQNQNTNQTVDRSQDIVYSNSKYGFGLTFPQSWKGYTVKNRILNWGSNGTSDSLDFGFPAQDSLLNISMHTKSQWQKIKSEAGPTPTYLGENSRYVFGYSTAQDASNSTMIARMQEIQDIIKTFELVE